MSGPTSSVAALRQNTRSDSMDPRNDISVQQDHYIGIDVGTGSARACIINEKGDIVGLASKNIGLWQPETGYYVCSSSRRRYNTDCSRNNLQMTSGGAFVTVSSRLLHRTTSM